MPTLLHSKVLDDFQWTIGCSSQAFSSRPNLKKSKGRRSNSSSQEICFLATEWVCFETPKSLANHPKSEQSPTQQVLLLHCRRIAGA